jgi:hypothetical protein
MKYFNIIIELILKFFALVGHLALKVWDWFFLIVTGIVVYLIRETIITEAFSKDPFPYSLLFVLVLFVVIDIVLLIIMIKNCDPPKK